MQGWILLLVAGVGKSLGLGRTAESWLAMQDSYNLWHARKTVNLDQVVHLAINP
jgi:plasmid maintenance system antidote protein VapI